MPNLDERSRSRLILLAIFLLAVFLRVSTIATKSIWVDETYSLQQARQPIDWIAANPWQDPHPPGYYLLLHETVSAFGQSELWLRLPSALFGALSVLVVYGLCLRIGSQQLASWAALLLALDPVNIWYSQEARMYTMLAFFAVCGVLLTILLFKRPSIIAWLGTILTLTVLAYADYIGLIFWLLFSLTALIVVSWRSGWTRFKFAVWLSAQAAIALLYLPQWPKFAKSFAGLTEGRNVVFSLIASALHKVGLSIDQQSLPLLLLIVGSIIGVIGIVASLLFARRLKSNSQLSARSLKITVAVILFLYVGWLIAGAAPRFYSIKHQLAIGSPFIAIGAAYVVTTIRRRSIVYAVVGLAFMAAILNWAVWPKEDWRSAANLIAQQSQPGDVIIGAPGYVTASFNYYYAQLPGAASIITISDVKKYPNQRLWLIIGTTQEQGSNDPVPGQLTSSHKALDHWQLYNVEIFLLQ